MCIRVPLVARFVCVCVCVRVRVLYGVYVNVNIHKKPLLCDVRITVPWFARFGVSGGVRVCVRACVCVCVCVFLVAVSHCPPPAPVLQDQP